MENEPPPEQRTRAASERAEEARKLAESLEERAEDMHRAAAAAQTSVAQFAEMVREHEPEIASKLDVDPERYRRRAASETARADQAHQRREEDLREDAEDNADPSEPYAATGDEAGERDGGAGS
jgi:hypothetical protein